MEQIAKALEIDLDSLKNLSIPAYLVVVVLLLTSFFSRLNKLIKELRGITENFGAAPRVYAIIETKVRKLFGGSIFPLVAFGLCINLIGYSLRTITPGSLFLDMGGTAAVALTAGPIWGAFTGIATNIIIFAVDTSAVKPYLLAFGHTNAVGGLAWGFIALWVKLSDDWPNGNTGRQLAKIALIAILALPLITLSQYIIQLNEPNLFDPRIPANIRSYSPGVEPGVALKANGIEVLSGYFLSVAMIFADKVLALIFGWFIVFRLYPVSTLATQANVLSLRNFWVTPFIGLIALVFFSWVLAIFINQYDFSIYSAKVFMYFWGTIIFLSIILAYLYYTFAISKNKETPKNNLWLSYYKRKLSTKETVATELQIISIYGGIVFSYFVLLIFYLPWYGQLNIAIESLKFFSQILLIYILCYLILEGIHQNTFFYINNNEKLSSRAPKKNKPHHSI